MDTPLKICLPLQLNSTSGSKPDPEELLTEETTPVTTTTVTDSSITSSNSIAVCGDVLKGLEMFPKLDSDLYVELEESGDKICIKPDVGCDSLEKGYEGLEIGCGSCPVCDKPVQDPLLLHCLHSVCRKCCITEKSVECDRCRKVTELSDNLPVDYVHKKQSHDGLKQPEQRAEETEEQKEGVEQIKLLTKEARAKTEKLPDLVIELSSRLGKLQDEGDNARSLIEETYQSYKAVLEQCKDEAFKTLEKLHNEKELWIMDKLDQLDLMESRVETACSYSERLVSQCEPAQIEQVQYVVGEQLKQLTDTLDQTGVEDHTEMTWSSDEARFTSAVRETFGSFAQSSPTPLLGQQSKQTANEFKSRSDENDSVTTQQQALTKAIMKKTSASSGTPSPSAQGLLCPLSPTSPSISVPLMSPDCLPVPQHNRQHGAVGTSPTLLSHSPAMSGVYPSATTPHTPRSPHLSPSLQDYNLAQLASVAGVTAGYQEKNTITLADLISNVGEEGPGPTRWEEGGGGNHALSNLAALAKLDELHDTTSHSHFTDPTLLMSDLERSAGLSRSLSAGVGSNPVSPGAHSVSPVMGSLAVPGLAGRGTSPASPLDTMMPPIGLSVSPVPANNILMSQPMLRSPGLPLPPVITQTGFPQPRSVIAKLNTMQIRCKFGQLGPGKGQFNSPHGFCLGLEEEIIVADTNNHRIQVFEKNGTYRYQFGIPGKEEGQLWYPRKVAVMKNSGKFVVCDRGNERSRMQIFTKHGHFVRKIAIRYIDIVAGLAISREGNIVAVDSVTPTMFIISEQGDLLRWFDCADYMREPSDIAVGGREYYVCDFKGHNVVVFTEDGAFVRRIGCENITNFPNGIDISDAGDILIGDSHGNRFHVAVFANDGSLLSEFECPHVKVSRCCGLKITSEGYVVTLAKNNHHVLVLNTLYIA